MSPLALINELSAAGVRLTPNRGKLQIEAPRGVLTDDLRLAIAENKDAIIAIKHRTVYIRVRIDRARLEIANAQPDRYDWQSDAPQALEAGRELQEQMGLYIIGAGSLTRVDDAFRAWLKALETAKSKAQSEEEKERVTI
jgi:phage shock protein A